MVLRARVAVEGGWCRCGQWSGRVHGRYVRSLRDVAVGGVGVIVELQVRRFRCQNPACPAVMFAEQIQGLTRPHSRFTPLLLGLLARIGLALAGRAGARLTAVLGVATGRDRWRHSRACGPSPGAGRARGRSPPWTAPEPTTRGLPRAGLRTWPQSSAQGGA
ncbi:transposase family protein [Streptomyces sp. IBSBF 2435]|uniref:transposase family protein n=1 Tax=Streptomyces sp. IBSBF 2435 TaxID=2903531 RepID=UPI003FA78733